MSQHSAFVKKNQEGMAYKLHKALYGLKKAPRAWTQKIDSYSKKQRFQKREMKYGVYVKHSGSNMILVCLYGDDILLTGSCNQKQATYVLMKSYPELLRGVRSSEVLELSRRWFWSCPKSEVLIQSVCDEHELRDDVVNNSCSKDTLVIIRLIKYFLFYCYRIYLIP